MPSDWITPTQHWLWRKIKNLIFDFARSYSEMAHKNIISTSYDRKYQNVPKISPGPFFFTCVAEGESRSRSAVTPSVCPSVRPSQNLVIAAPLKLLIKLSWNLVCRYDIICSYAYQQEILIPSFLWELCPLELRKYS